MRIYLIVPPWRFLTAEAPPLGVALLAAVLEQAGHVVRVLDWSREPVPSLSALLAGGGMDALLAEHPDMVGLSVMSSNWLSGRWLLRWVRENLGCPVVVGGPHATVFPRLVLEEGADFVIRGEGEETLLELVRALEDGDKGLEGIPGLSFRRDGRVVHNRPRPPRVDLGHLPCPAYHHWNIRAYVGEEAGRGPILPVLVGRGEGSAYRPRSPRDVAVEMASLARSYGSHIAHLVGDVLYGEGEWLEGLARQLTAHSAAVEWRCQAPLERVSPRLLAQMREVGCRWIDWYWDGEEEVLRNWEAVRANLLWMSSMDIVCIGHFRLGGVGERLDSILRRVERVVELDLDVAEFSWLIPCPATPEWERVEDGRGERFWREYYESVGNPQGCAICLNLSEVTPAEMKYLLRKARYMFDESRRRRKYQLYFGEQIGEALWWVSRQPWIHTLEWRFVRWWAGRGGGNGAGEETRLAEGERLDVASFSG